MKRFWQSAVVMFFAADAILLLLFGRRWVRFTRFGPEGSAYVRVMDWFLAWPDWLLRLGGLLEAAVALKLFARWQPGEGQETASG
jgi:hypothetical protein